MVHAWKAIICKQRVEYERERIANTSRKEGNRLLRCDRRSNGAVRSGLGANKHQDLIKT